MVRNSFFQSYKQTMPPSIDTGTRVKDFSENETTNYNNYFTVGESFLKRYQKKKTLKNGESSPYFYTYLKEDTKYPFTETTIETPMEQIYNPSTTGIVSTARNLIGSKYSWGGLTPTTGFDCSGFVNYVYSLNGIDLNARTVSDLEKVGKEVELSEILPGDIVCYNSSLSNSGKHVRLIDRIDSDGKIWTIDARGKKYGVVERELDSIKNITTIRRILNS